MKKNINGGGYKCGNAAIESCSLAKWPVAFG